jgi:hypothetical protein
MYAPRPVPFAKETPDEREKLSESRTLRGAGVAGVATVGIAGIEVARQMISEAQGAVLQLVGHLEGLRWLFIGLALAGIMLAAWARVMNWKQNGI